MAPRDKATRLELINQWFAQAVPHNKALGMVAVDLRDGALVSRLPYDSRLVGNPETGFLHGGVVTSLLDATSGVAVLIALSKPTRIATLDLRIDYLKPAGAQRDVWCIAHCYKATRHVAFVRATAHNGDESDPIASGTGTFVLFGDEMSTAGKIAREAGSGGGL